MYIVFGINKNGNYSLSPIDDSSHISIERNSVSNGFDLKDKDDIIANIADQLEFNCITEGQIYLNPNSWIPSKRYDNNGNLVNAESMFYVYPLIDISNFVGKQIIVFGNTQNLANNCFFDINNNFISAFKSNVSLQSPRKIVSIVPENAKYLGLNFWQNDSQYKVFESARLLISNNIEIKSNSTNKTINLELNSIPSFEHLNNRFTLLQKTTIKNLFTDFSKFIYGKYINALGEQASLEAAAIYNDFIEIPSGETKLTIVFSYQYAIALYDSDKNFLQTIGGANQYDKEYNLSLYPTAKYVKINVKCDTIPTHPNYDGLHPCYAYFGKKYNENENEPTPITEIRTYGHSIKKPISLQNKNITFFGDSITWGYSSTSSGQIVNCYAKLLCDYFQATINNQAISGSRICDLNNSSSSILNKILNYSGNPDIIFIAGGTNDYGHSEQSPLGNFNDTIYSTLFGSLNLICQHLKLNYPNIPVIFITPINRTNYTISTTPTLNFNDLRNAIWRVAINNGYSVIDGSKLEGFAKFGEISLPIKSQLLADGLHPTDIGHEYMANYISSLF